MIIGLTGPNAAGKGEAARFLEAKGFHYLSLSDVIREELQKAGRPVTRENLIQMGRRLRAQFGNDYLARRILEQLEADKNYIVDSIRHPDEVRALRSRGDFRLVSVNADPRVRFERIKARARESDPQDFDDFLRLEQEEATRRHSEGQDLVNTMALADVTLANNGSLEDLHGELARIVQTWASELDRPSWDEYFMGMARMASLRANCLKRKVGAVIVRDRRVVSTGYNGTPRGTRNCYEGGCPRCNSLADSGTRLDECLCSHAEENAITQAAYHGVSVKDGILYTTYSPCLTCTKMIINAGIREVVYNQAYPLSETAFNLLKEAGVSCRRLQVEKAAL